MKDNPVLSTIKLEMEGTMNIVLGVHVKHDRSACIIIDGRVVVNIANERLDRVKYSDSPEIPYTAVDAVLKHCNIDISQVSCIGMSGAGIESEKVKQFYKDDFFAHYRCREIPFSFCHIIGHTHILPFVRPLFPKA